MYAVVKIRGKQFNVSKDGEIVVWGTQDELNNSDSAGKSIVVEGKDIAAFVDDKGQLFHAQNDLAKVSVKLELLKTFKDKKIIVFKKKRRQGYRKLNGHRSIISTFKVLDVKFAA